MAISRLLIVITLFAVGISDAKSKPFTGFGTEIDSYIRIAAQRYQISEPMLRGLIKMEDGWYGNISPTGATGVGQFTVGTWNWLGEQVPRGACSPFYLPFTLSGNTFPNWA